MGLIKTLFNYPKLDDVDKIVKVDEIMEVSIESIEYAKYLNGNESYVSFDDMLLKIWRDEINTIISEKPMCSLPSNMELLETLLFNGCYTPFLARTDSEDYGLNKFIKTGKGQIYVNDENKTECLIKRKNMLVNWLNNTNSPGEIYLYRWLEN